MRCVAFVVKGGEQISYIGGLNWYPNNLVRFRLDGAVTQVPAVRDRPRRPAGRPTCSSWLPLERWPAWSPRCPHLDGPTERPPRSTEPKSPGYRGWRLISAAHEEGNLNDLRAILGNDVAKGLQGREASVSGWHNHCPTCLKLRPVGRKQQSLWPSPIFRGRASCCRPRPCCRSTKAALDLPKRIVDKALTSSFSNAHRRDRVAQGAP
jgi:hypothetical protein